MKRVHHLAASWGRSGGVGIVVVVALVLGAGAGCGAGSSSDACDPVRRESFDPNSSIHVLPGADEPTYLSDPPTSGPHQPGRRLTGVLDEPIARPVQVGALEAGQVLVQHRGLPADAVAELRSLAGDDVVVVPNPDLPDAVVATAWLFKLQCDAVDTAALQEFVDDHVGNGPGSD